MATRSRTATPQAKRTLSKSDLLDIYRLMLMSRRIDDKEIQLKRQNKIYFQISGAGHEAVLTAAGRLLRPGRDWFYPYYRDRALCLQLGVTPREMFLEAVGSSEDPASGGRQMPSHWGHAGLRIVSQSSPTGTQFLQAVGCAEAERMLDPDSDAVVYVSGGDGAVSEGEFWESINAACLREAPVLYLITDNSFAISVPIEVQTAGGSISALARSFPGLQVEEVDGCDPIASYAVLKRAIDHLRSAPTGPALVHARTIRPYSHSLSDDERLYKTEAERDEEARRDPIPVFGQILIQSRGADQAFLEAVREEVDREVDEAAQSALAEAAIIGRAIGMATRGLKPVVEIQFFDYFWPAMMQVRNELAPMRWRSNGAFSCPVVVRVPVGGYLQGGAVYHSQSGASLLTAIPGLRVVMPSNALDAKGLLRTAIRCDDSGMFLEHKHLYRQTYNKSPYPGPDHSIPFGRARVVRQGSDLTVVTYGALVERSLRAAKTLASQGTESEVIDLRSLNPFDWETVAASVAKTGKVIVAYEDSMSFGYGAEIAALIADRLFEFLDAPVRRVAALDTFVAYEPGLEDRILPQVDDLVRATPGVSAY